MHRRSDLFGITDEVVMTVSELNAAKDNSFWLGIVVGGLVTTITLGVLLWISPGI